MAHGPTKDLTLDGKLRTLDKLYDEQFAQKGTKKEGGVEVATFSRR